MRLTKATFTLKALLFREIFCSDLTCLYWWLTLIIIDLYLTLMRMRLFSKMSRLRLLIRFLHESFASPATKHIYKMIHGIKTDKLDALVANISILFFSGGRQTVCQLKLSLIVVLPVCCGDDRAQHMDICKNPDTLQSERFNSCYMTTYWICIRFGATYKHYSILNLKQSDLLVHTGLKSIKSVSHYGKKN